MATNEPNKPDNVINIDTAKTQAEEKTAPGQPVQAGGEAPAPEKTAAPDKAAPESVKQARKGRPPKVEKAAEQEAKKPRKPRAPKQEAPAKEEAPHLDACDIVGMLLPSDIPSARIFPICS